MDNARTFPSQTGELDWNIGTITTTASNIISTPRTRNRFIENLREQLHDLEFRISVLLSDQLHDLEFRIFVLLSDQRGRTTNEITEELTGTDHWTASMAISTLITTGQVEYVEGLYYIARDFCDG